MTDAPVVDLTIYLVKKNRTTPDAALKNTGSLDSATLSLSETCEATVYIRKQASNLPRWANFFSEFLDPSKFGRNSSTGAILSIPRQGRRLLLTFGQGWNNIDSSAIEVDFGLRTALNLLNPTSIRSIDKSTLEGQPKQLREQSGRATEIQYFGIDVERDLLQAVTGTPIDKEFGPRVSGLDSVHLSLHIAPKALPDLLDKLLLAFTSDEYKNGPFSWIDHIAQIRDPEVIADLDRVLVEKINRQDIDRIWLTVPEIIDWNRVVGFRYSMSRKAPRVHDVWLPRFLETFTKKEISKPGLMRRKIYCVDADGNSVLDRPSYNFLYAEVDRQTGICLLNNGKWYRVESNYADTVNRNFTSIKLYKRDLPQYIDDSEGAYNARVAHEQPEKYVLMDTDLAYIPGAASGIEICDLYRQEREFIHVKRYGGSSVLSHLFNQGLVSGELFKMDPTYREIVNSKLPEDRKLGDCNRVPGALEYSVVYAIVSASDKPLSVPFFSKISLRHCITRLQAMGFDAMLGKISVSQEQRRLEVLPPGPNKA
ncbi:MAG TPA: TIGR04141 family sporadically distributed protein [Rhodanobacteraceae bacterium]|nr:TIGR04141 family sporadically distributed protein [Rhodanobacteraceae bacterium]